MAHWTYDPIQALDKHDVRGHIVREFFADDGSLEAAVGEKSGQGWPF
jgi:hypothetical protein